MPDVSRRFARALVRAVALGALSAPVFLSACRSSGSQAPTPSASFLSAADVKAGWRSMVSLDNWRGYQTQDVPTAWSADDSILTKTGVGNDIVSKQTFTDFELAFDWKVNPGGNSGVFYRATEEYEKIYWSAPEYAILDDARHPDGKNPLTSAGAAHSLYASPRGVVHEADTWNSTLIRVKGTHVEHWLNGQNVAEYDYGSPDFTARVAGSKFGRWPNFAKAKTGLIGIQGDHRGQLAYRYLRIRELR